MRMSTVRALRPERVKKKIMSERIFLLHSYITYILSCRVTEYHRVSYTSKFRVTKG